MTIKKEVLKVIETAKKCVFAEDISHIIPHVKLASIRSACWELVKEGTVFAKKKDRQDGTLQAVFYSTAEQLAGVEGLMNYERRILGPRTKKEDVKAEDVMIAIPLEGGKTDLVTIGQARKIYNQLAAIFKS